VRAVSRIRIYPRIAAMSRRCLLKRNRRWRLLNELIELAPIKPNPTTRGAIVNFYSLALRDYELGILTNWAVHVEASIDLTEVG
jgi:hypothetical protein